VVSQVGFGACASIVAVAVAAIFLFVGVNSYQTFTIQHIDPRAFFTGTDWNPGEGVAGALIPMVGTLLVTLLAVLLSAPISVATAIFITQVAPPWARRFMQPVLELFTGIPSIIYGLLGLQVLVPLIGRGYNALAGGFFSAGYGLIAAGLVLSIMILPTITSLSVDALSGLPGGLREASLALGATRWQTIRAVLLPGASSGVFTGVILGIGRAIGETLAVALVIGSNPNSFPFAFVDYWPYVAMRPTSTITVQLLQDFKEATPGSLSYDAIWTLAFILLVISFLLVLASRAIAARGALRTQPARRSALATVAAALAGRNSR
jgi:phosphate transport system permease protein